MKQTVNLQNSELSPRTYKIDDIVEILDIGRTSAYNLVNEGHFKTVRIGTSIRISKRSFDNWLDGLKS